MSTRLRRFLLFSLLLHAGVLLAWPAVRSLESAFGAAGGPLRLVLQVEEGDRSEGGAVAPVADMQEDLPSSRSEQEVMASAQAIPLDRFPGAHAERRMPEAVDMADALAASSMPAEPAVEAAARPAAGVPGHAAGTAVGVAAVEAAAKSAAGMSDIEGHANAQSGSQAATAVTAMTQEPAVDSVHPGSASKAADAAAGDIVARLHEAVETHFYYPPLARRHGWEGEVRVALRVERDGRLSAIRVLSSSGHRVLDSAAVDTLMRLARLPGTEGLPPAGMETVLPVRYRLLDAPA